MTIVAIIPARGGSKGISQKNLEKVGGLPLVRWPINAARQAKLIDEVYVSTDDPRIANVAQHGATIINRPAMLATDESFTPPTIVHAIESIAPQPEIIVVLQCTTPFTTAADIDAAVELLLDNATADCVVSVCRDTRFQLRILPTDLGVDWLTVDRSREEIRRQDLPDTYCLNGGLFAYRTEAFLAHDTMCFGDMRFHVMPEERSIEIDTPYDLHMAQATAHYLGFS